MSQAEFNEAAGFHLTDNQQDGFKNVESKMKRNERLKFCLDLMTSVRATS